GGEMHAHDLRVDVSQLRIRDAELHRQVAAQVVEHGVAALDELAEDLLALRVFQIEAEAALVAVERLVEVAVAGREELRSDRAADVAAVVKILDLDDLGAEVGEVLGAERPRPILLDRDDPDAGKRQAHARFLSISCLAMMMRCISLVPSPITSSGASR